jgi:LuxR family maltose regulon positive regulatory protein
MVVGGDTAAGAVTVAQATPRLIGRARLLAALDRAVTRKVTVISAPAGSGKTSALRAWAGLQGQHRRLAVVQVQRDQRGEQDFWLSLLDAVGQAGAPGGAEPSAATPGFSASAMADRVLSALAGASDGTTLVLDDLHELNPPDALGQVGRLLASLPDGVHAIVATRRDLPLRLHRLRLAGELAEIRAADLSFSAGETRELLAASGIGLSAEGTALLHQRTEGWAAGLRLAALSLAGHPDPERFVREFSGSDRAVAEYLIAEMLDRQPGHVQDLLLRTCLLDRVNGELADLLTGRPGSERILLDLEEANAFVVSVDPGRTWFRYHHLFADLLRLELRRTLPAQVPELHRRAASWFSGHGQVIDAIRHTQAAGDWSEAARLLTDHSFSLILDGHAPTVKALVRAFPPGAGADPGLALVRAGYGLVQGHLDEAAAHLAIAKSYAGTTPPGRRRRLQVAVASLRLWLAQRRADLAGVVEQVELLAAPEAGQSGADIALDADLRALALLHLGTAEAWSPGHPDAERHLLEGAALARRIGRPYLEVACLAQLGVASTIQPFATTQLRCREAIALAERYGWGAEPVIAPALVTLAGTMVWLGQFDDAERCLARAAQALETDDGPDIRLLLHQSTGMLHACRGRYDEALEEFSAAAGLRSRLAGSHKVADQLTGWKLATQARAGLLAEARAAVAALADDQAAPGEVANARAALCLAEGDPDGALGLLRGVLDAAVPVIGYVTVVEAHLLAGLAYRELGDQRAAGQAAERALALAEPDRIVLPFAMTGSAELLRAVPWNETAHAALLADILGALDGASPARPGPAGPPLAAELSKGELRVLGFLPSNLSRPEIAAELSVSVNTVSTHVRSIYAKLLVGDRSSAVRRARELRLLAGSRLARQSPDSGDAASPAGPPSWGHGPGTRPVHDPDQRAPWGDDALRVPRDGRQEARRAHRAHRAAGPVGTVRRASGSGGARPGAA